LLSLAFLSPLIIIGSIFYGYRIYDLLSMQILQVIPHDGELEPPLLQGVGFVKLLVPIEQALAMRWGSVLLVD